MLARSRLLPARLAARPSSLSTSRTLTTSVGLSPLRSSRLLLRPLPSSAPLRLSLRRFATTPPPPSSSADLSLSQRLKKLFRTHGWSALVIYLALSLADFSLTFLLVYSVGADRVRDAEDWVLDALGWRRKDGEPGKIRRAVDEWKEQHPGKGERKPKPTPTPLPVPLASDVVADKNGYSAIATTAVLAYAIHKTLLLPVRIGITVAITPKIVRALQGWG